MKHLLVTPMESLKVGPRRKAPDDVLDAQLGVLLRETRKETDMTISEAARVLGIKAKDLVEVENGRQTFIHVDGYANARVRLSMAPRKQPK